MSDENDTTPGQQGDPSGEQGPGSAPQVQVRDDGILTYDGKTYIDKGRFDGAIRKIEELTQGQKGVDSQLEEKISEIERLKTELATKEAENSAVVGERDKKIEEIVQNSQEMKRELEDLRALKLKAEVVKEIGDPSLMLIVDKIPNMTDKDALIEVMGDFAEWRSEGMKEREQQILAGVTPAGSGADPAPSAPETKRAWEKHLDKFEIGSKERQKAFDEYYEWLQDNPSQP